MDLKRGHAVLVLGAVVECFWAHFMHVAAGMSTGNGMTALSGSDGLWARAHKWFACVAAALRAKATAVRRAQALFFIIAIPIALLTGCSSESNAAPASGFHDGSSVNVLGGGFYHIGVESLVWSPPRNQDQLSFQVGPGTLYSLRGTSAFQSPCNTAQYLASVIVDNIVLPMNAKLVHPGSNVVFVDFSFPQGIPITNGAAVVAIDILSDCQVSGPAPTSWEFQGVLHVE